MPDELRRASGAAAPMYAGLVFFVLSDVGGRWRGRVLVGFAALFALGALVAARVRAHCVGLQGQGR